MSLSSKLLAITMVFVWLDLILYVIFGQLTVKKLRKNPNTKHKLGVEFASGWDILNVAKALAIPMSWSKKLENSPLSALYANAECLRQNTTRFDQVLAAVVYWLFVVSGGSLIILTVLHGFGFD